MNLESNLNKKLIFLTAIIFLTSNLLSKGFLSKDEEILSEGKNYAEIYYSPSCPHCSAEIEFLSLIKDDYSPDIGFKLINVESEYGKEKFIEALAMLGLGKDKAVTPLFVFGEDYISGYANKDTTGSELISLLEKDYKISNKTDERFSAKIPILGEISFEDFSLFVLASVIGLVDGFNPCAMWVLLYMISVLSNVQNQKRMWLIAGIFLLSSGILYFLLMTAWLNIFWFLDFKGIITTIISLCAIYFGLKTLIDLYLSKGKVECDVGDPKQRSKTLSKIDKIVMSPINLVTIASTIALAFLVNSIEFICSAALPAVFTGYLSSLELETIEYYFYIFIYVLFFMLDDLAIFALAIFSIKKFFESKYMVYSKLISAIILITLGIIITAKPSLMF